MNRTNRGRRGFAAVASMLAAALLVAACGGSPGPEARDLQAFAFTIDPQAGTVTPRALSPQADANPPVLEIDSYAYAFLPGNMLRIDASFMNGTTDKAVSDIVFTPDPGNSGYVSSTEPDVPNSLLGPDAELTPGESTPVLEFFVEHANAPFTYVVNADATIRTIDTGPTSCVVTITNPAEGATVSSNVLVQGTVDAPPDTLAYRIGAGAAQPLTAATPFSFSISSAELTPGANAIAVDATVAGAACTDTVNVTFDPDVPPPAGNDIVVVNDINVFDQNAMANPNNVLLVQNLVDFPATGGSRDAGTVVMFDRGRNARCTSECSNSSMATMRSTIIGEGYTISDISSTSGSLTSIPADVRVIFLWTPQVAFTTAEINAIKQFASEGGRTVFIGEHSGYYGAGIPVENKFLEDVGAVMTNTGGAFDCGYQTTLNVDPHQITDGLSQVRFACASELLLGPDDFSLWRGLNSNSGRIYAAVAKIDVTPITFTAPAALAPARIAPAGIAPTSTGR